MTNQENRNARQATAAQKLQSQASENNGQREPVLEQMEYVMPTWNAAQQRRVVAAQECIDEDSLTPTPDSDYDLDEEGELSLDTCSSFSLQECIDEFKARRMRRISTHSRDIFAEKDCAHKLDPAEEDLINQNRCNKEQERKCKPCKDGFCYCFTSDSGDALADGVDRVGAHVRQNRRSRKSDSSQIPNARQNSKSPQPKERRRQSAPAGLKSCNSPKKTVTNPNTAPHSTSKDQITAISRLQTSPRKAPLIHIIQELHNNCVISEVRVNKHKIQAQRSRSLSSKPSPKKTHFNLPETKAETTMFNSRSPRKSLPSAPPLDKISELESLSERFVYSTSLNSSSKSNDSPGRRHKAAGLLLQKRLSQTHTQYKPRNLNEPPPKPPRCSFNNAEDKTSVSTLASTTPSLREAERVLDDFLRSKGVALPCSNGETKRRQSKERKEIENQKAKKQQQQQGIKATTNREKRKSYPLIQPKSKINFGKQLPTCPSLTDIERMVDDTKKSPTNYEKNIRHFAEKPIKEHSFGWKEPEPEIHHMLSYDANANKRRFRSQAVQAEPQTVGWHMPPKMALDTVDGEVRSNLAANISKKVTPVKTRVPLNASQKSEDTQKFILSEQLKSFVQSPWTNKSNKKNDATTNKPKSSLKSSSRNFLNNSKKRILKLVSPKKDNRERRSEPFAARRTPLRSIGIQTSREELRSYEASSTPQSPPGSYFSAVQTSQPSSSTPTCSQDLPGQLDRQHFDFNRKVHSPPKKPKATLHRKLSFPRNNSEADGRANDEQQLGGNTAMTKTYRSFHSELDQDVTVSRMGFILSNIRAKLEASDDHAMRTFQEIERREQEVADGFDYPDSAQPQMRHQTRVDLHRNNRHFAIVQTEHDPIYSEIEEDSMHVSNSPQFESKGGIEHFPAARDPNALYAKVIKRRPSKPSRAVKKSATTVEQQLPNSSTSLAQCMRDSLKSKIMLKPLPPLPPTPHHAASTYSAISGAPHSQSLNNIRVMEHNSPPKRNRHLSKSDLSLQRSEIFLENLCRSEIIIDAAGLDPLEKVQNSQLDESSYISINSCGLESHPNSAIRTVEQGDIDDVSYELPNDAEQDDDVSHAVAGSQLGLNHIDPPHSTNQSTPKKSQTKKPQTFTTKPSLEVNTQQLSLDISTDGCCLPSTHQSSSCPNTPRRLPTKPFDELDNECSTSLIEVSATVSTDKKQRDNNKSALARYQRLKNVLRKSLRKSKKFVKTETKRLSSSLSFPAAAATSTASMQKLNQSDMQNCGELLTSSSLNLDSLFSLDGAPEEQPLQHQLAKAVCICRQLPDLEISPEMVEAERLLLFSTLRRDATKAKLASCNARQSQKVKRFYVDAMRLPIRTDASQDLFFNYFYIGTFYCDGVIRSTQSVECCNHEAIFSDCGIELACSDEAEVKCEIFMLRLRKVSTISLEPTKKSIMNLLTTSRSSVGSSCDDIVSRFRLHGSFTISSRNFVPYEYVELPTKSSNSLCLSSSTSCKIAITPRTQSTNLATEMLLTGRAEVQFIKFMHSGFLNVQHSQNKHHWNRRWCTLDGLFVRVWQDVPLSSDLNESELPPLLELDLRLRSSSAPLECATSEQCARPRSFALECCVIPSNDVTLTADLVAIFFVADTHNDLNTWLMALNKVLDFINQWMK